MTVKGRIANFYSRKSKVVEFLWKCAQVTSLLFVVCSVFALFFAPGNTAMGVVMKVYDVYVIALMLFLFIYKVSKKKLLKTNELYIGYYIGLCMMGCMNLVIISVIYGSQSNLIEIVGGRQSGIVFFRLVSSFAIFCILFYLLYAYFHIRFYSDILTENRGKKIEAPPPPPAVNVAASQEMVLYNKPQPAAAQPSQAMVLAQPQLPSNPSASSAPSAPSNPALPSLPGSTATTAPAGGSTNITPAPPTLPPLPSN